jgi:hypothetical protein
MAMYHFENGRIAEDRHAPDRRNRGQLRAPPPSKGAGWQDDLRRTAAMSTRLDRAFRWCRCVLAPSVRDPKIVLGMLVEVLGGNPIAGRCRFPRQSDISLEDLLGRATDPGIGAAAIKCPIGLRKSWLLLSERSVWLKAATRPLIGS